MMMRMKSALMTGTAPGWAAGVVFDAPADSGVADVKKLADELKTIGTEVKTALDNTKKTAETALAEVKNLGDATKATKEEFDKKFSDLNGLVARMTDVEQKMARASGKEDEHVGKSLGDLVMETEGFKKLDSSFKGQVRATINVKDITSATSTVGSNTSVGTSLVPADRQPGIVAPPERQMTIRDLLAPGQTNSNAIEYAQETGFTNAAAVVSEGVSKPKSNLTFELRTANVRTIAHYFKASRQIMDDAPALRSYIDARARYGLRYAEEQELLAGDGTGQHIDGLITQATAYSAQFTPTAAQRMDTIRLAMLQVMLAEFPPTGIVLHPTDWAAIQLTKDAENRYIIGNPQDGNTPRLWNLPVVETQAMSLDTFLVGNFRIAAQIFDKLGIEVLLSTENEDDFIKNMITIRAEERLALAVYRPEAFVYGDFGYVT